MNVRNEVIKQLADDTGEDAATISQFIRAYYDLRLKQMMLHPDVVAQFDAAELSRASDRAEAEE